MENVEKRSLIKSVKNIRVEKINKQAAKMFLDKYHELGYSNCTIALGVFLDQKLEGVLTLGSPVVNSAGNFLNLKQHQIIELRKMYLTDICPKNSESRVLAIVGKLIKKNWPNISAIITYCDDSEPATGYKAAGWKPWKAQKYIRSLKINGKIYTMRDAGRHGLIKQATEKYFEHRRKWVFPLTEETQRQIGEGVPLSESVQQV